MTATFLDGAFNGDPNEVHVAGPLMWTSRMFPLLEPYTEEHRKFFANMLNDEGSTDEEPPPVDDGLFVLLRDFVYVWQNEPNGVAYRLTIPAGFITDDASIPWLFQNPLMRMYKDGPIRTAALGHDFLYQVKDDLPKTGAFQSFNVLTGQFEAHPYTFTKADADRFFAKVMKAYNVRLNYLTYMGVHLFGFPAYWHNDPTRGYTMALSHTKREVREGWNK